MSTGLKATVVELPQARLSQGDEEKEWQSRLIERYQRRARSVDSVRIRLVLLAGGLRKVSSGTML